MNVDEGDLIYERDSYKHALSFALVAMVSLATRLRHSSPSDHARMPSICRELDSQLQAMATSVAGQIPEHLHQKCLAPFWTLHDVLRLLETAHPDSTAGELMDELGDLTTLIRSTQRQSGDETA